MPPQPASRSSLFVIGDDHVSCGTRSGFVWLMPRASGDTRGGSVMPVVKPVHVRQFACSSQKTPTLFLVLICQVTRPLMFSDVRSLNAGWLLSGAYNHWFGLPAFRL